MLKQQVLGMSNAKAKNISPENTFLAVGRTEKYLLTPNIAHTLSCKGDIDVQLKHFKYNNVKIVQFSIEKYSIF